MKGAGSFAVGRTEFLGAGVVLRWGQEQGKPLRRWRLGTRLGEVKEAAPWAFRAEEAASAKGLGREEVWCPGHRKEAKWLSHVGDGKWGLLTLGVVLNSPLSHGKSFGGS